MNIALVDPAWSGHTPTYLKCMGQAIISLGHRPIIFSPEPIKIHELISASSSEQCPVSTIEYHWPRDAAIHYTRWTDHLCALQRISHLNDRIHDFETKTGAFIDLVFMSSLDDYIGAYQNRWQWNVRFKKPFSGIYFLPRHLRLPSRLQFFRRLSLSPDDVLNSSQCRGIGLLDEELVESMNSRLHNKLVLPWPDITDETYDGPTELSSQVLNRANGRRIVGMIGSLARRKGILDLIRAFQSLPQSQYFLAMIGPIANQSFSPCELSQINSFLSNPPENALVSPRRIADGTEFNALVKACDVLWLAYRDFPYSSNLITKAAVFRIPVVVSKGYLMDSRVRRYSLGLTVENRNVLDMKSALQDPRLYLLKQDPAFQSGCTTYSELHGQHRLIQQFKRLLDTCNTTG